VIVQECGSGLVQVQRGGRGLAFAAPPLVRYGPLAEELLARLGTVLGVAREGIVDAHWVDNGPGWAAVLLAGPEEVLSLRPSFCELKVGVAGPCPAGSPAAFEVRAFFPKDGSYVEDPVTGSLNAALARWLLDSGRASAPYVVSQGAALGRAGRVHVSRDAQGEIWVAGATATRVAGELEL
jgi:PhzF family phenazine biosynthesis protein